MKWLEAKVVAEVIEKKVRRYNYNDILCIFGVPHPLVMDNGKQFDCKGMIDLSVKYDIIPCYAFVAHSQSNRQVETVNKTIKESI